MSASLVGSEMCIRDRDVTREVAQRLPPEQRELAVADPELVAHRLEDGVVGVRVDLLSREEEAHPLVVSAGPKRPESLLVAAPVELE
eukprot:10647424-Alexandrium_andersonii.AAC.1